MRTLLQLTMFLVFVMHQVASDQNDCGNTSFSGSDGVVTSPNFPLPYPHDLSCTYSIDVGRNNSVLLKFLEFDLQLPLSADNCTRDWLMITCNETDDENLDFRKRYCGTDLPRTSLRFFNCAVVQLKFFADSSVNGGGFAIEYTVLENSTSADSITDLDCGDTLFTSSSGFIRLPSNPTEYSATVNCTYTISTDHASTFSLGVLSLQQPQLLDSIADCDRDYIMVGCISDGETELNPNTSNTYCRRSFDDVSFQPSRIVFSSCRIVKISIRSSDYNLREANGFPFAVRVNDVDCGSTFFNGPTGNVTSPQFPLSHPHSLDCVYFVDVDRTKTVTIYFLLFNLEGTSRSPYTDVCSNSSLTVSCLLDSSSVLANPNQNSKYCGEKPKPMLLNYSNCDSLAVNFFSNSSVNKGEFQLRYTITSPGNTTHSTQVKVRGNTSLTGPTGFIISPQFPLFYPHNVDHVYSIAVDRTKMVGLYFYSFNIEGTPHNSYMDICHYDWLLISSSGSGCYNYESHKQYFGNRKFCGEKTSQIRRFYHCDSLTLNFVTDSSLTSGGFKIWYKITSSGQSDCGNTSYSGPNGVVTSPNFPFPYPNNLGCTYSIDVGRNSFVELKFKHFELEAPNSAGYCANNWLKITCNETKKTNPYNNRKYCGAIKWTSALRFVDCSSLTLEFFSGTTYSGVGSMIEYTVAENSNSTDDNSELDCGATLFTDTSGNITLPLNPTNYLATVNCTYTILINRTSVIWLNTSFTQRTQLLQSFQDCDRENLMVGCVSEGETEMNPKTARVFCHRGPSAYYSQWSPLVFVDCRTLKLSIRSNTYDYRDTFRIPFLAVRQDEICGNTSFSAPTGIVSTLRLPFHYPKNVNCLYTIDNDHVESFAFSIDNLFVGCYYHSSCNVGSLTITCLVNGTSMAHPFANRALYLLRYPIKTRFPACDRVFFNFSSNDISFQKGFTVRYRIGDHELDCGATLFKNSSGEIILPRNPTNFLATVNCTYTISANNLSYIWLNTHYSASWIQLLESFQDCDKESLTVGCVSDGNTELNPSTTRVFCHQSYDSTPLVFADCRTLQLSIRSSTYDNRETFRVPFSVIGPEEICGNTSFSAQTGIVSSPRLGFRISKRVNCLYTIDIGHVNSVVLRLDRLDFENPYYHRDQGYCSSGWLTITCLVNGTSMAHPLADRKLCRVGHPSRTRFPACHRVIFNFSNNYISPDRGFTIRYRIGDQELDCGATLFTSSSVDIILPRNPTNYLATVNCTYTISANNLSYIWLNTHLYTSDQIFHSFQNCDSESLTFGCLSEGETELNPSTAQVLCRRDPSSHQRIRLEFADCRTLRLSVRSSTYDYGQTFRISFSVLGPEVICGNTSFSTPTGIVSSPRLGFRLSRRIKCLYTIDIDHVNSVALSLDRLLYSDQYCTNGWLTLTCLVNGTSMAHPLANRKLCALVYPTRTRFPACHRVLLNFSSTEIYSGKGFTIRYRIGDQELDCGATLFTNSSGFIDIPRNPTNFLATVNCTYTISTNRTSDIWLRTSSLNSHMQLFQSFTDCDRESLTIGCVSKGQTELNPNTTRVFCRSGGSAFYFSVHQLVFFDCRTLKLSIRSNTYDFRETFRIPFTVYELNAICGNTSFSALTGIVSTLQLSFHYPKGVKCLYTIDSGHVNSVALSVDRLNLGSVHTGNGSCYGGWLTITCLANGTSMAHPLAERKLCGNINPIVARFPACRSVLLNFSSDHTSYDTGFFIRYRIGDYDPECGNTSFSGPDGFITSPRFPLSYPHNLNCLYSITGGQRNKISLSILSFRLEGTSNTPYNMDYCYSDWLTVSCLSDESVVANLSSSRKYCGVKTTPLAFAFSNCAAVVLNFRSDSYASQGGFIIHYTVRDLDIVCGVTAYGRPSGTISFPWNYTYYDGALDCNYVINAVEPSSISLTIWSISLQSSVGDNCQRDWLLITCIDGQLALSLNVTHLSCDYRNSSIQQIFPGCAATQIVFHRDVQATGKTFRIEYTITSNADDNVPTTEMPTTSISATKPVGTDKSCATGCKLSSDSTKCDCLPVTSQTPAIPVTTEIPVTRRAKCEVGCKLSADGTTCDCSTMHSGTSQTSAIYESTEIPVTGKVKCEVGCEISKDGTNCDCYTTHSGTRQTPTISVSTEIPVTGSVKCEVGCEISKDGTTCHCSTTHSGDLVVNTPMSLTDQRGRTVGVSLTVILVVIGALCLGAFLLFRRHRKKNRSELLMQATEEERAQMELEADSTKAESSLGAHRNQDRDVSRYLPLKPISFSDHDEI